MRVITTNSTIPRTVVSSTPFSRRPLLFNAVTEATRAAIVRPIITTTTTTSTSTCRSLRISNTHETGFGTASFNTRGYHINVNSSRSRGSLKSSHSLLHFRRNPATVTDFHQLNRTIMAPQRRLQNPTIFVCDIQEKFRKAIWEFDKIVLTTNKLLKAASILSIPVYATTQNAKGLGPTVPEVQAHLNTLAASDLLRCNEDKTRFSMWVPPLAAHFQSSTPSDIAIVGIESHVCVTQTALDALGAGHKVYIIADGVSSCNKQEVPIALDRLRAAGAIITSSESWLYEVMGDAGIEEFRNIVGLVKETSGDTKTVLKDLLSKL